MAFSDLFIDRELAIAFGGLDPKLPLYLPAFQSQNDKTLCWKMRLG